MTETRRILLVEDDPHDAELALRAMGQLGLADRVDVARDGVEALDYLHRRGAFAGRAPRDPAVVLLDLKMSRVGGVEFLRRVKEEEWTRRVPVVALTSSREPRDLEECYRLGVNAYVVKPVSFRDFIEVVRNLGVFWGLINALPGG